MDESSGHWDSAVEYAALSDVGLRRNNNQDSSAVSLAHSDETWRHRGHLFLVADGMGAHAAGELASKIAADNIPLTYRKLRDPSSIEALRLSIEDANEKIHSRGAAHAEFHGMGTTASVLLLTSEGAFVAHVGDSRVYRIRGDLIEQLSFDHSLVWEITAGGQLRDKDVPIHIPKNIITRSLGPNAQVQVDLEGPFETLPGDTYVLCSDGLSGQVDDREIGAIVQCLPPQEAARTLIDVANLRGGPDNITAIVVRVKQPLGATEEDRTNNPSPRQASKWEPFLLAGLFVTLVLFAIGLATLNFPAAIVGGICALVIGISWLSIKLSAPKESPAVQTGGLGRGPYTRFNCPVNSEFTSKLAKMSDQLKEAAQDEAWSIDWQQFNSHQHEAQLATDRKDYVAATREYAHAISFMMSELRNQRSRRDPPKM